MTNCNKGNHKGGGIGLSKKGATTDALDAVLSSVLFEVDTYLAAATVVIQGVSPTLGLEVAATGNALARLTLPKGQVSSVATGITGRLIANCVNDIATGSALQAVAPFNVIADGKERRYAIRSVRLVGLAGLATNTTFSRQIVSVKGLNGSGLKDGSRTKVRTKARHAGPAKAGVTRGELFEAKGVCHATGGRPKVATI